MAMICSVCRHPRTSEIDDQLDEKKRSVRQIAAQFNLPPTCVQRHKRCIADRLKRTQDARNAGFIELLRWAERLERKFDRHVRKAEHSAIPVKWAHEFDRFEKLARLRMAMAGRVTAIDGGGKAPNGPVFLVSFVTGDGDGRPIALTDTWPGQAKADKGDSGLESGFQPDAPS